jgi:hypothetical protein
LLPGLALDTLTVMGDISGTSSYGDLSKLFLYGDGWKDLHYISPSSELLGYKFDEELMLDRHLRQPQPSN